MFLKRLNSYEILSNAQHDFHQNNSCKSLLVFTVLRHSMTGNKTDAVVLDFSKAFDKVP